MSLRDIRKLEGSPQEMELALFSAGTLEVLKILGMGLLSVGGSRVAVALEIGQKP